MSDPFAAPGDSGGTAPGLAGRLKYDVGVDPPKADPIPCNSGIHIVGAIVSQHIEKCADAQYFALYQIAEKIIDSRLDKLNCAAGCSRWIVEIYRTWKCANHGTADKPDWQAEVRVHKGLSCADKSPDPAPGRPWLNPAQPDSFTNPNGVEPAGANEGTPQDSSDVEIGKAASLDCSETRSFFLHYRHPEPNCPEVHFKKYVDAAAERIDALLLAIKCAEPCVPRKTIEWQSWKCDDKLVVVDVYFKLECLKPKPEKTGAKPGCLASLLSLPFGLRE